MDQDQNKPNEPMAHETYAEEQNATKDEELEAWFLSTNVFDEGRPPREHAALLLNAPREAQLTSLHCFLRGQFSLRLLMEMQNGQSFDALIPKAFHAKLLDFIHAARSKATFSSEVTRAAKTLALMEQDMFSDKAHRQKQDKGFERLLRKYDPRSSS